MKAGLLELILEITIFTFNNKQVRKHPEDRIKQC